jgi:hypothetical protein
MVMANLPHIPVPLLKSKLSPPGKILLTLPLNARGGMSQRALQMLHGGNSNLDDVARAESA